MDSLGLMSVNLVPDDIWAAAYINIIREGVDLFVPSVIDSNNLRPDTKAKIKVKSYQAVPMAPPPQQSKRCINL